MQPGCEKDLTLFNGVVCSAAAGEIRRISFHGADPAGVFRGMYMKVLRYDDDFLASLNKTAYELDRSKYSNLEFIPKKNPSNSWTYPFVTGHKYKIHWAHGLDFM